MNDLLPLPSDVRIITLTTAGVLSELIRSSGKAIGAGKAISVCINSVAGATLTDAQNDGILTIPANGSKTINCVDILDKLKLATGTVNLEIYYNKW